MRQINDRFEPKSFTNWVQKNKTKEWKKFTATDEYSQLKDYLISSQEKMCCYCEIALKESKDAHIEHLKDRHNYPHEKFVFTNLYVSCQCDDSCGHKKGNKYFDGMVLPNSDCQPRFTYTKNGRIIARDKNDNEASKTIKILNLNTKRLINIRKGIIRNFEKNNDLTIIDEYIKNCVEWVNGFITVFQYVKSKLNTNTQQ